MKKIIILLMLCLTLSFGTAGVFAGGPGAGADEAAETEYAELLANTHVEGNVLVVGLKPGETYTFTSSAPTNSTNYYFWSMLGDTDCVVRTAGSDTSRSVTYRAVSPGTVTLACVTDMETVTWDKILGRQKVDQDRTIDNWRIEVQGEPCTVSFNANGGTAGERSRSVMSGETYGSLPAASRSGYVFQGWFTQSAGGRSVSPSDTVSGDTTLYAHWAREATVSFDAAGGTVKPERMTAGVGMAYGSLPTPEWAGRAFDGWYTAREGGEKILSGSAVPGDITLYAHWAPTVTVRFDAQGGTAAGSKTVSVGHPYGTLPTPTRPNYRFDGWYTEATGGQEIRDSDTVKTGSDHTLYAHWTKFVTVRLDPGDGTVEKDSITAESGSAYGRLPTPTRPNCRFDGWYTKAEGGEPVSASTVVTAEENHTLYAHWTKFITVRFDGMGGGLTGSESQVRNRDDRYLTFPRAYREGYQFAGWYTQP